MEIVVKSTKVLKTGTSEHGEWKLVKVTTEDTEYTTFAKDAELLAPGSTIDITDLNENDKGKSFKKFEIIGGGIDKEQSSTPTKSKSSPPKRDSSTNDSIEQQKAIMEIGEDWRYGKLDDKDSLVATYKNWIMSKLSNWASTGGEEPNNTPETKVEKPTEEQRKRLSSAINQYGTKEAKELLIERWQTNKTEHLSSEQMEDFIEQLTEEINDTIDLKDVPF